MSLVLSKTELFIFSVEVSFLMHFIYFQISDIKDALVSVYGVVPKVQCLPKQVRRVMSSFLSASRRQLQFF